MRKYEEGSGSEVRLDYGEELSQGLAAVPQTRSLAVEVTALNAALQAAYDDRLGKRRAMRRLRAAVRLGDLMLDTEVRRFASAVRLVEGGRLGAGHRFLFPEGLSEVTRPAGRASLAQAQRLLARLPGCPVAEVAAMWAEWGPRLTQAASDFEARLGQWDEAVRAYREAFQAEVHARDAHFFAIDRIQGLVRAALPRDRALQDAIFPPRPSSSTASDEPDEPDLGPADPPSSPG